MREIKFRAWDKIDERMKTGVESYLGSYLPPNGSIHKHHILMQYTGLKDKNGKEIYEGDIIKILQSNWLSKPHNDTRTLEDYLDSLTSIYEVVYKAPGFIALLEGEYEHTITTGKHGYIEIIGNKRENPELLLPPQ